MRDRGQMRALFVGIVLGAAIGVGVIELRGQPAASRFLTYTPAKDVAATLRDLGETDGNRPVLTLAPYTVLAEHRVVTKNPPATAYSHKDEAELYYITEGSATLVTGRMPDQPTGGTTQQIRKGDVLIIPENTPHWLRAVDEPLSYISMHMPRAAATSAAQK